MGNLQKVSTYARTAINPRTGRVGVSTRTVYVWLEKGKVKGEVIDGVQYVVVEPEKVS